jgi:hypothetical protein
MLPSKLLRFKDLTCVGITNWVTLKRRVERDNFPPGRYLGENTRVWDLDEVTRWWDNRPSAAPPNVKPAADSPGRENGSGLQKSSPPQKTTEHTEAVAPVQARDGGAR